MVARVTYRGQNIADQDFPGVAPPNVPEALHLGLFRRHDNEAPNSGLILAVLEASADMVRSLSEGKLIISVGSRTGTGRPTPDRVILLGEGTAAGTTPTVAALLGSTSQAQLITTGNQAEPYGGVVLGDDLPANLTLSTSLETYSQAWQLNFTDTPMWLYWGGIWGGNWDDDFTVLYTYDSE